MTDKFDGSLPIKAEMEAEKSLFKDFSKLMRLHQWTKNGFVLTGFFFSEQITNFSLLFLALLAALAFCFASSSVYIYNDLVDLEKDKIHPKKRERPLASGKVSTGKAKMLLLPSVALAVLLGWLVSYKVALIILCYLLLNVFYTFWLKHLVIIDVFCISFGFMLRILAGTTGIDIPPSEWLLLCGMMLTLFLGFTKRKAEIDGLPSQGEDFRKVLTLYDGPFLDQIIAICASGVIISYSLYTMSHKTIGIHHTTALIITVPFVAYGVFRYLFLLYYFNKGEDPSSEIIKDPQMIMTISCWAIISLIIMIWT